MKDKNPIKKELDLSFGNWLVVALLFSLVVAAWYVLPKVFGAVRNIAELATYFVGACAVAASAYSVFSANRLKEFELGRGYRAARSLVASDACDALSVASEFEKRADKLGDDKQHEWQDLLDDVRVYEQRYERKQDQLSLLSTHFSFEEFMEVRKLYSKTQELLSVKAQWSIANSVRAEDIPALLVAKRGKFLDHLKQSRADVSAQYQNTKLGLDALPAYLNAGSGAQQSLAATAPEKAPVSTAR